MIKVVLGVRVTLKMKAPDLLLYSVPEADKL